MGNNLEAILLENLRKCHIKFKYRKMDKLPLYINQTYSNFNEGFYHYDTFDRMRTILHNSLKLDLRVFKETLSPYFPNEYEYLESVLKTLKVDASWIDKDNGLKLRLNYSKRSNKLLIDPRLKKFLIKAQSVLERNFEQTAYLEGLFTANVSMSTRYRAKDFVDTLESIAFKPADMKELSSTLQYIINKH